MKEILIMNDYELKIYSKFAIDSIRQNISRKGFQKGKVPDMLFVNEKSDQINDLILRYGLASKYGKIMREIGILKIINHSQDENKNHIFELELWSQDESILNNLTPTEEYNNYINQTLNNDVVEEIINNSEVVNDSTI